MWRWSSWVLWSLSFVCCFACCGPLMSKSLAVPADQVKQGEQEYPDDVDEVPVQPEVLYKGDMPGGVGSGPRPHDHEAQDRNTDDHVQGVHASHGEVKPEVHLGVPRHVERQGLVAVRPCLSVAVRISERFDAVVKTRYVVLLNLL